MKGLLYEAWLALEAMDTVADPCGPIAERLLALKTQDARWSEIELVEREWSAAARLRDDERNRHYREFLEALDQMKDRDKMEQAIRDAFSDTSTGGE